MLPRYSPARVAAVIVAAHLVADTYFMILPPIYPLLIIRLGVTYTLLGLLTTSSSAVSSAMQVFFGYLSDKRGRRLLLPIGLAWLSIPMGAVGFIDSYLLLLFVVTFAALGSALFHPEALSILALVGRARRGVFASFFISGGNLGLAFAPLLTVAAVGLLGLSGTMLLAVPGLAMALLTFKFVPSVKPIGVSAGSSLRLALRPIAKPLSCVLAVAVIRTWTMVGVSSFLPSYAVSRGLSLEEGSLMLFVMLIGGATGGLLGGYFSDIYGRRRVIALSLLASTLLLFAFISTSGVLMWLAAALFGAASASAIAVTLVAAQELLPEKTALASGLTLGMSFGVGGVGSTAAGAFIDAFGFDTAYTILALFPLAALLLSWGIPSATAGRTSLHPGS